MNPTTRLISSAGALLLLLSPLLLAAEPQWRMQYFFDEGRSTLAFADISFASASRGVAAGTILQESGRRKHVAAVTSDGGKNWSLVPLQEQPVSLFFLNEGYGWLVTTGGIWFTDEAGRSWRKLHRQRGLRQVHFVSPERGWAVGTSKLVLSTQNGGKTWEKLDTDRLFQSRRENSTFHAVEFANPETGMITGRSRPPRRNDPEFPVWMDPEAGKQRPWPSQSLVMQTRNGGTQWTADTTAIFGQISAVELAASGQGLLLIEHEEGFQTPSEVFRLDWRTGKSSPILQRKDLVLTAISLLDSGTAFAAGYKPPGRLQRSPVPGRLSVLQSRGGGSWTEMTTDWRAVATHVAIASVQGSAAWLCTDTGMILRLDL